LNLIKEKPYIKIEDYDEKKKDKEISSEQWENHIKRNKSIIVDLFHGQLKSTITCPTCKMISLKFDPFMYLSLPIPQKNSSSSELKSTTILLTSDSNVRIDKYILNYESNVTVFEMKNLFSILLKENDL
jgi:ubiquitin carboxyl-terminal hydrolase 6/32